MTPVAGKRGPNGTRSWLPPKRARRHPPRPPQNPHPPPGGHRL